MNPADKKKVYIETSISASDDDIEKFKPLSVEEASNFINFLVAKLEEEPVANTAEYRVKTIPVRIYKQFSDKYKTIKAELKKKNISFSEYYKKYYFEFLKSIHKNPK